MTMHYRHIKKLIQRADEDSKMALKPVLYDDWMRWFLDMIPNRNVYYVLCGDGYGYRCLYESKDPIMWFFESKGETPYVTYYAIGFHLVDIVKAFITPNNYERFLKKGKFYRVYQYVANIFQTYVLHLSWMLSISGYKFNQNDFDKIRFKVTDDIKVSRQKLMAYIMMYIYNKAGRKHRYLFFDKQNNIDLWKLESTQEIY